MTVNPEPYQSENVPLFEMLYGQHLISLGGTDAIDNLFSDIDIDGKTALDIGFGTGGVAFYLAKNYGMTISGVELTPWMADYATQHAPKEYLGQLTFKCYDSDGNIPYHNHAFDIVYSKGVLNHVSDKIPLLQQSHARLKQGGKLVIADWIYPTKQAEDNSPLTKETQQSYLSSLESAGFSSVNFRDDSGTFAGYVQAFINNLESKQVDIEKLYGEKVFDGIRQDHQKLLRSLEQKQKIAVRIIAQ